MSTLTDEEITYFSRALTFGDEHSDKSLAGHSLSVETEIPQMLAHILGNSKLTLLAEISYYRLWFPLQLNVDELGIFSPSLGTPEVIDMRGSQRSWRLDTVKGVKVVDINPNTVKSEDVEVLSLSSSGMTMKMPEAFDFKSRHLSHLVLPNGTQLDVAYEPVRAENGIMAAKIIAEGDSREMLRDFLFKQHKAKYRHLYKSLTQPEV